MENLVLISIIVVGIAVILLAIGLIIGKREQFPSGHIHDSKPLAEKGINCAQEQMEEYFNRKNLHERLTKNSEQS